MDAGATPIETLLERAENYAKTSVELIKLSTIDKTSDVVSSLMSRLAVFMIVALFAFVINIGLSLWIGDMLGKNYYGFFAVAGFYLLLVGVFYTYRTRMIKHPIQNSIIAEMLKEKPYGK
jgi:hypothetical protein